MSNIIEISNLSYSVDNIKILKNIDLTIDKGEFLGLIGPNGAGKTTLLKCINGIYKGSGEIKINSKNIKTLNSKNTARLISFMQQNTTISYPFSTMDIVLMGRYPHLKKLQKLGIDDFKAARESMEFTDTIKFEKKLITEISGGERQSVLFAKVLTQKTDIMMLDEPTANLDIRHQEEIFNYSLKLAASGKTVIAAVHDLKIAARYCNKLILMKGGEIIATGTPEEVITSENIYKAYSINALVYRNNITGILDLYIGEKDSKYEDRKIHVIGGGGSAAGVIRYLFEKGYKITAGVFSHGDSDLGCCELFKIPSITTEPFSEINMKAMNKNIKSIKEANITVLCNMPFGQHNIKNLEGALYAEKLIIIEDEPPENRDFSEGEGLRLYNKLKEKAYITTSARFHELL